MKRPQVGSRTERLDYWFSYMVVHLARSAEYDRLFQLIEETTFLAEQTAHFESFQQGSRDLEAYVLPSAISCAEGYGIDGQEPWPRFLRLVLVAANLRGMAVALAEETILEALVRNRRHRLALGIAGQLTDPIARAEARAVIIGAASGTPAAAEAAAQARRDLEGDIEEVPQPKNEELAEAWCRTLCSLARLAGPTLRELWHGWIGRLRGFGDREQRAWEAVAESFLRAGLGADENLYRALDAMGPRRLRDSLPSLLAKTRPGAWKVVDYLASSHLGKDTELLFLSRIAVLGRQVREGTLSGSAAWGRLDSERLPWSLELVEIGHELWPRLGRSRLENLERSIENNVGSAEQRKVLRAALRVIALEGDLESIGEASAREAVQLLSPGPVRSHWYLRALAARRAVPDEDMRGLVAAVGEAFGGNLFEIPAEDLSRFLDLVAGYLPERLERLAETAFWSPASTPETLRTVAFRACSRELLEHLLACAEKYAAAVAGNDSEGFELRREILIQAACRLARRWGDPTGVERAAERLLPEEEEQMRAAVVAALAEEEPGFERIPRERRLRLARQVNEEIRSPRLGLLSRLRITDDREELAKLLGPAALFRAIANTEAIDDECRALAALLATPADPEALAGAYLSGVKDENRRILGLVDLARHALTFQEHAYRPGFRDPIAALQPVVEAVGGVAAETLVSLTPELAELGARAGPSRAAAEFRKAFLWLVDQTTVPWPSRLEALWRLLASLGAMFSNTDDTYGPRRLKRCRKAASALRWMMEVPSRGSSEGIEALRRHWHELLPKVMAAAAGLPPPSQLYLRDPLGARLCLEWLWPLSAKIDCDRLGSVSARVEAVFTPRWPRWSAVTPWSEPAAELLDCWDWLVPEQRRVVSLCCAAPEEWRRRAERLVHRAETRSGESPLLENSVEVEALIDLLAVDEPELLLELIRHLPAGERKSFRVRSLRDHLLPRALVSTIPEMLEEGPGRWEARAWLGLGKEPAVSAKEWLEAVAKLVARNLLDPLSPRSSPLRRHLWEIDPELACPALARAALEALAGGGQQDCENALRLWLHSYIGHRPGHASPSGQHRCEMAQGAIERARSMVG